MLLASFYISSVSVCVMYADAFKVSQLTPDILLEKEGKVVRKHLEMVSGHNAS